MTKKSPAQLDGEIAAALSKRSHATKTLDPEAERRARRLEDAIEAVYNRKGSEDLTLAEACEAVHEMGIDANDKKIAAAIKTQIPDWF